MKSIEELKQDEKKLEQANEDYKAETGHYSRTITSLEMQVRSKIIKRETV